MVIDSVIDLIIEKYKVLEDQFDYVLVEGTSFSGRRYSHRIRH